MAYIKKVYKFRDAIEVEEYHTGRYGAPGIERQKKRKRTPEQVKAINQYNKEKRCRHKLRTHFHDGDYLITCTYKKDERPEDMEQCKKDISKFMKQVKKEYAKAGIECKWIRNIEVGEKGAWHFHLVINRIPDTDLIVRKAWTHGKVIFNMLYENFGDFASLAGYMTKTPETCEKYGEHLKECSYSTSRNLPTPEAKKTVCNRWKTWKHERKKKGWYVDKNTYYEGINPVTGYPFRRYTFLRSRRD